MCVCVLAGKGDFAGGVIGLVRCCFWGVVEVKGLPGVEVEGAESYFRNEFWERSLCCSFMLGLSMGRWIRFGFHHRVQ